MNVREWCGAVATGLVGIAATLYGCSDGSSSSNLKSSSSTTVPLDTLVGEVNLTANTTERIVFTFDMPVDVVAVNGLTVDLTKTLQSLVVTPAASRALALAATGESGQVYAHVGPADEGAAVCNTGETYGPFTVALSGTKPTSITPASATATPATLWVVNSGSFALCLEVLSPVSGTIGMNEVTVDTESCEQEPQAMAGTWSGTYSCTDTCGEGETNQPVTLTISQDNDRATYVDNSASYKGTVCGNEFKFSGGASDYSESGTFTLTSAMTATKNSNWQSKTDARCRGTCTDTLTKN